MSAVGSKATQDGAGIAATTLAGSTRRRVLFYLSGLILLMGFGSPHGGLVGLPIGFMLKNKLHLNAHDVAIFRLIGAAPLYLGFLFGFARDTFNPFRMHDRGFIVLFSLVCAATYLIFAFMPLSGGTLLLAVLLATISYLFVSAAQHGLTSMVGQRHLMSGQISAVWNSVAAIPGIAALLLGGALSDWLESRSADQAARVLFLIGAAIMVALAAYGAWRPKTVYDNLDLEDGARGRPLADLKRLLTHWSIYPALLIWLMWDFAPGSVTSLQYYLQDTLHANDAQWGEYNAIVSAAFIPTFIIFGILCRSVPLSTLLFWGAIIGLPQFIPLLFIHSIAGALIAAGPMGLMGGIASAAYLDLIIRSCPRGLQGATVMMAISLGQISARFSDVLGTSLYDHFGGYSACVIAITAVYALILPTLRLVPARLTATADGQTPEISFGAD